MPKIKTIRAREILDSKGEPTVEAEVETELGVFKASVPSGVSVGKYEAVEVKSEKAVENIEEIITPKLKGEDPTKQEKIDDILIKLDGTENKSKLGANATLPVSIACLRAGSAAKKIPLWKWISKIAKKTPTLPSPCILSMEGGLHGRGDLDVQEFMVVSQEYSFSEQLRMGTEIYHTLGSILSERYGKSATNVGLEGGFTPPLKKTKQGLDLVMTAVGKAGYKDKVKIILDIAASSFFKNGKYHFEEGTLTREELLRFYLELLEEYPIVALEDPFDQEDWQGWQQFHFSSRSLKKMEKEFLVVGDDLTATNLKRIREAKEKKACDGLVLKPNQVGTVSETIAAANLALQNGWQVFVKHRGGETCDDFIADLAVGLGTGWLMAGAPARGERVAKYNRLLKIEEGFK